MLNRGNGQCSGREARQQARDLPLPPAPPRPPRRQQWLAPRRACGRAPEAAGRVGRRAANSPDRPRRRRRGYGEGGRERRLRRSRVQGADSPPHAVPEEAEKRGGGGGTGEGQVRGSEAEGEGGTGEGQVRGSEAEGEGGGGIGGVVKGEGRSEGEGEDATWREILRVHVPRIIRVLEEDGPYFLAARKTQLLKRQFFRLNRSKGTCNLHATVLR